MAAEHNEPNVEKLIAECLKAKTFSYSPYSKFQVGAAIETVTGEIFRGCNIENAAYSGCICAERTAISKAVSEGHTKFKAIAISSNVKAPEVITPCGHCRQFMREFSKDLTIYLVRPDSTYKKTSLVVLFPMSFGPEFLL